MNELMLSQFPQTKRDIQEFAAKLVESVVDGDMSPLLIQVQLSAFENVIAEVKKNKDFKEAALNEAMRYGVRSFEAFNANIQVKETGVKYDYSLCCHPQYEKICSDIEFLTEKKKSFEKYLQTLSEPTDFIDPESGEMCKIHPPVKTSTTAVAITINK